MHLSLNTNFTIQQKIPLIETSKSIFSQLQGNLWNDSSIDFIVD